MTSGTLVLVAVPVQPGHFLVGRMRGLHGAFFIKGQKGGARPFNQITSNFQSSSMLALTVASCRAAFLECAACQDS